MVKKWKFVKSKAKQVAQLVDNPTKLLKKPRNNKNSRRKYRRNVKIVNTVATISKTLWEVLKYV